MPDGPALKPRRAWTEDCRVLRHATCHHIGSAETFGLLGRLRYVTICSCLCHWGCPSEEIALPDMMWDCLCPTNGETRQENFDRVARRPLLDRMLGRRR